MQYTQTPNPKTNPPMHECPTCLGEGSVELAPGTPWDVTYEYGPCPTCNGKGYTTEDDLDWQGAGLDEWWEARFDERFGWAVFTRGREENGLVATFEVASEAIEAARAVNRKRRIAVKPREDAA